MPSYTGLYVAPTAILRSIRALSEDDLVKLVTADPISQVRITYDLAQQLVEAQAEIEHLRATFIRPEDIAALKKAFANPFDPSGVGLGMTPANIRHGSLA